MLTVVLTIICIILVIIFFPLIMVIGMFAWMAFMWLVGVPVTLTFHKGRKPKTYRWLKRIR